MSNNVTDNAESRNTELTGIARNLDQQAKWAETWATWQRLYDMGFNLIPAKFKDKKPLVEWKNWQTERVSSSQWDSWKYQYRLPFSCNMLLITGKFPGGGLIILEGDDEASEEYLSEHTPATSYLVETSKGWHRGFLHPGSGRFGQVITHTIDGEVYKIDRKGDGNYVVAPGSTHKSGHVYRFVGDFDLSTVPEFDPRWIVDEEPQGNGLVVDGHQDHDAFLASLEGPENDRTERAGRYLAAVPGTISGEGTASNHCLCLCSKLLWGFGLTAQTAQNLLCANWAMNIDQRDTNGNWYPWTEKEIAHKIRTAVASNGYSGIPGDCLSVAKDGITGEQYRKLDRMYEPGLEDIHEQDEQPRQKTKSTKMELGVIDAYQKDLERKGIVVNEVESLDGKTYYHVDCKCCNLPGKFVMKAEDSFYVCRGGKRAWESGMTLFSKRNGVRRLLSESDILAMSNPEWLIKGHLLKNTYAVMFGAPNAGKSFVAIEMAYSIALGMPFLGKYKVSDSPQQVVYIHSEGGNDLKSRIQAWRLHNGITESVPNIRFIDVPFELTKASEADEFVNLIEEAKIVPTLVIIDTLNRNFGGDENSNVDMTKFNSNLESIRSAYNCTNLVIHHSGKDITKGSRGGSALLGNIDTEIRVVGVNPDPGATNYFRSAEITISKTRATSPLPPYTVDKLEIQYGHNDDDHSLVLVPSNFKPVPKETKSTKDKSSFLSSMTKLFNEIMTDDKEGYSKSALTKLMETKADEIMLTFGADAAKQYQMTRAKIGRLVGSLESKGLVEIANPTCKNENHRRYRKVNASHVDFHNLFGGTDLT